jgi:hypothetical protein
MNRKQYKHASRVLRCNGWDYTRRFFRSYPDRLDALCVLEAQKRDALDDKAYMQQLNQGESK